MSRQHTSNIICHIILYIKKVKMIYLTHIIFNPISSVTSSCILKKVKMIYLTHIISNSNFVFTVLFYMTRWTKPDHTCIYFQNNLNYLSVALNLYRPFVAAESIAWTFFVFRSNKIHISPTGIVSSLSPPWCHLSSDRCCHAVLLFLPMESRWARCLRFIFWQHFILNSISSPFYLLSIRSTTPSELHSASSFLFTVGPRPSSIRITTPTVMNYSTLFRFLNPLQRGPDHLSRLLARLRWTKSPSPPSVDGGPTPSRGPQPCTKSTEFPIHKQL
jgi:hypothetical protein